MIVYSCKSVEDGIAECYAGVEQAYSGTISIICVYRCPKKNAVLTGSSIISKYLLGKAFDFDQLSSLENWRVARCAYISNSNYEILLYYKRCPNCEEERISISEFIEEGEGEGDLPPENPHFGYDFTHGHIGIN